MPQFGELRNQVFEVAVKARVDAEIVVPLVGKIETDRELVDARIA